MQPLSWVGPLNAQNGYGQASIGYLCGLLKAGVDLRIFNSDQKRICPDIISEINDRSIKEGPNQLSRTMVFHMDANVLVQFSDTLVQNRNNGIRNVSYMAFETDSIPSHWYQILKDMDLIIVPSEANKMAFIKGRVHPDKIRVLPHIVHEYDIKREPIKINDKKSFAFLSIFDFTPKKGWMDLLTAYWQEFKSNEDVCLILKIFPSKYGYKEEGYEIITRRIVDHKRVVGATDTAPTIYLRPFYSSGQMESLWDNADAFVLPTRGEGFGLPIAEAAMHKKPIIVTDYSGHTDYLPEGSFYPIKSNWRIMDDVEMALMGGMHYINQNMRYCDTEDLRKQMRKCYEENKNDRQKQDSMVQLAYDSVNKVCNETEVTKKLIDILELNKDSVTTNKRKRLIF